MVHRKKLAKDLQRGEVHVRHDAKVLHERKQTVPEDDCAGTHVRSDDGLLSGFG